MKRFFPLSFRGQSWWNHIWLSDGFASWAETLFVEAFFNEIMDRWTNVVGALRGSMDCPINDKHAIKVCFFTARIRDTEERIIHPVNIGNSYCSVSKSKQVIH